MGEGIFKKGEIDKVKDHIANNPHPLYAMRNKAKSSGVFLYSLTAEEVLSHVDDYELFSVAESLLDADKNHMILQGAIQITNDWICRASLNDVRGMSNRQAENNPKYKLNFSLLDDSEPPIQGLRYLIDYYISHELFELVMEFGMYDIPVGVNKDNIIIWEIRSY
jgi:hypothetical protein